MERAGRGGGPGGGRGGRGYMKGRLPEGVDFKAYPGRSSTPLPTAESKGAERINQLKIWNEAATNDDKRGLKGNMQGKQALATAGSGSRRTDSFKDAKERHSASFNEDEGEEAAAPAGARAPKPKVDMFADRSDDSSEDEAEKPGDTVEPVAAAAASSPPPAAEKPASPVASPPAAPTATKPAAPAATPEPQAKEKGGCCVVM